MYKSGDDYVYKGWRIKPVTTKHRTRWHVYPPGSEDCPVGLYVEGAASVPNLAEAKRYIDGGVYNGPMTDEG